MADDQYTKRQLANVKTQFDYQPPGVDFNLMMGIPGDSLLKKSNDRFKKGAVHRLGLPDAYTILQYGPEPGDLDFRTELAKFLTQEYMDPVRVDDLIVTNGATQGLCMLTALLFSAGDLVFVEDPTYFVALKMLRDDLGLKCVAVPIDSDGIIPDILEERVIESLSTRPREVGRNRPFSSMLYLISTFHNPTGVCLSPERCKRIVDIARKYNLLVVCDDVYNLLAFSQDEESSLRRKRLFAYDNPSDAGFTGNVVSNATFSKIFSPGIRLGWQELPQRVKKLVLSSGWLQSSGSLNHTTSGIMTSVISLGLLQEHLKESRFVYKTQCDAICSVLRENVPSATFTQPQGGYFLWVKLPDPVKAADLLEHCKQKSKIMFSVGNIASITSRFQDCVRISFSYYEPDVLKVAAKNIADGIMFLLQKK